MNDSHRHIDEKKPDTEENTLYGSIYMVFRNRLNQTIVMMSLRIDGFL